LVFAGLLGEVGEDLSVFVGNAGQLITLYAIVYAVGSPVLVRLIGAVARRRLLIVSLSPCSPRPTWRWWCFPRSDRS
jgi:predicted MFS family arabinose efflux permease